MSGTGANATPVTATAAATTAATSTAASGASTAAATGTAETARAGWVVPTNIGQCKPPAGNPAATFDNATAAGLRLVDDAGQPVNIALDANTLLIGAATWCGNTAKLKAQLVTPEAQQALAGLRVVWAFGDEGGSGPHGVAKAEFLDDLPGEKVFLAADSVRPWRFPSAFNGATGQFDLHPLDVIESYLATRRDEATGDPQFASRRDATTGLSETPTKLVLTNAAGAALVVPVRWVPGPCRRSLVSEFQQFDHKRWSAWCPLVASPGGHPNFLSACCRVGHVDRFAAIKFLKPGKKVL